MTNVESLSELMLAYIDGDAAAFARLHARLHPVLTRRVGLLLTDPAAVDDVVQTSFLRAHQARERFEFPPDRSPDQSVLAWYSTVARRTALDDLRGQVRRRRRDAILCATAHPVVAAGPPTPEEAHLASEVETVRSERLQSALQALPDGDRQLIIDHKLRARPLSELARERGLPPVTIRVRAHRAYQRLARALGAERPVMVELA